MLTRSFLPSPEHAAPPRPPASRPLPTLAPDALTPHVPSGRLYSPPAPVPLDTPETSVEAPIFDIEIETACNTNFRHSGWEKIRDRVYRAVCAAPSITSASASRFARCGQSAWVENVPQLPSAGYRVRCERCHSRWCTPCATERAARLRRGLQHLMGTKTNLSFITLTFQGKGKSLLQLVDAAAQSFKDLRALPFWKSHVAGGAWIIEWKPAKSHDGWNVHLHVIAECSWIDKKQLSAAWHAVTGDSFVIDIRHVDSPQKAAAYVTKYVTKSAPASVLRDEPRLIQAIEAMHGRRLVAAFGSWHGTPLEKDPYAKELTGCLPTDWQRVASVVALCDAAARGCDRSKRILLACRLKPPADIAAAPPPDL